ncbi:MAG: peptide chain release factor N(5)-glutamine methyltransferase [Gemmatimonadetes bacterium]|nr:peptide chain release factor N(5)-glutamine methyltransferase [Gemmatimonadota bacterium]
MITARALVIECSRPLAAAGLDEPHREARDLVAAAAGAPRTWPSVEPGAPIPDDVADRARAWARRRAAGEPYQYVVGEAPFRHLVLAVDRRVLIPRPETELLVEKVLARKPGGTLAVDVGTGSGAIALALASEGAFDRVIGVDRSNDALDVARANAARVRSTLRVPPEFREGDLLGPVAGELATVIVSNPPYIAEAEMAALPADVRDWEPHLALVSGADGLAATARLVHDAPAHLRRGGWIALEVDERRAAQVAALVAATGAFTPAVIEQDLTGRDRFVMAERLA